MKKLASLVLAGAMAFSLAACGNNSTPAGGSSANAGTSTPAASTPASGGIEPIELTIYSPGNENSVPTKTIIEYARQSGKLVLDYQDPENYANACNEFYDQVWETTTNKEEE